LNQAITRGLGWGACHQHAGWRHLDRPGRDSASQSIVELLNLGCSKGGLPGRWRPARAQRADRLRPADGGQPDPFLRAHRPVGGRGADALYLRYQSTADAGNTPGTFATTSVAAAGRHRRPWRKEEFTDLSSAGNERGYAQGVGSSVLKRFTRASFTDASRSGTASSPTWRHPGGTRGFYSDGLSAMVCQVLLSDFAFSGEVTRGP